MRFYLLVTTLSLTLVLSACSETTAPEHLAKGERYLLNGDLRSAVIELKNALRKAPELLEARKTLGRAHLALGDYPSAVKEFERALLLDAEDAAAQAGLISSWLGLGEFQAVLGELEAKKDLSPPMRMFLADAQLQAGNLALAEALYLDQVDLAVAQLGLGTIAWIQGDPVSAGKYFSSSVVLDPSLREAWIRKSEFDLSQREFDTALEAFGTLVSLPGGELVGLLGLARVNLLLGDLKAAGQHIGQLLIRVPDFPGAHYVDALIRQQQGDINGAERALREVQKLQPDHEPSLLLMGAVKYQQGQFGQAEDNLRRYLSRREHSEIAVKLLATVRFQHGDLDEVEELLTPYRDVTIDPQILLLLGSVQMRLGRIQQAVMNIAQAVTMAPDSRMLRNQLLLGLTSAYDESLTPVMLASWLTTNQEQYQSDYLSSLLKLKDGHPGDALNLADSLSTKDLGNPVGPFLQGLVYLGQGQVAHSADAFRAALSVSPDFFPAVANLAELERRIGNYGQAIALYERHLLAQPEHPRARLGMARLLQQLEQLADAEAVLLRLINQMPEFIAARIELAQLYERQGRLDDAAEQLGVALRQFPNAVPLLLLASEVALQKRSSFEAQQYLEALQLHLDLAPHSRDLHVAIGGLQTRANQLPLARRNLEKALELAGGEDRVVHTELLRLYLKAGEHELARSRLLAIDQKDDEVLLLEAELLNEEGLYLEALSSYRRLVSEGNREAVLKLGVVQLEHGDVDAALATLDEWLANDPEDLGVGMLRAAALSRQGDTEATIAQYEALQSSGDPVVLNNLAWLYMERGDRRAIATAERAHALAPQDPDIADTIGWVLVQFGQPTKAISLIRTSVEARPADPTFRYHLGVAYLESGELNAGRNALEEAMRLGPFPERQDAERRLQSLQAQAEAAAN